MGLQRATSDGARGTAGSFRRQSSLIPVAYPATLSSPTSWPRAPADAVAALFKPHPNPSSDTLAPPVFILSADDNDLALFGDRDGLRRCQMCRQLTNKWDEELASVPLSPAPEADASYSLDGVLVVSSRFKNVVERGGPSGLAFRRLQAGFFAARSVDAVPFDSERRKTRFENRCDACGQCESVIGVTPVFLKEGAHVRDDGFARTDLELGSFDEKSPLELCGNQMAARLRSEPLRGIDLMAVCAL